ncbi:MAG: M24 family metallopeptidase [Syntrophales bacterium LBB04]|nr:M24 family metallopeptidase [Syntrophales bacterium LBB04]
MYLSLKEKSRRYMLVREMLRSKGLSGIMLFSNAQINQQGFVRFFTDLPIPIYSHALLFLPDEEPFYFTPSPLQTYWAKRRSWVPEERIKLSKEPGHEIGSIIKSMKKETDLWGVVNYEMMAAKDYRALTGLCPKIKLVDVTQAMEDLRGPKSKEEMTLIRKSAGIAQASHRLVAREMNNGITEEVLMARVEEELRERGAERTFYLISSSPGGFYPYIPSKHRLDGRTPVLFSAEVSGPGGYWTQMVRTFFWNEPRGALMDMYKALMEIREAAHMELRPGRKVSDVAEKMRALIQARGFEYGVHFGHGLGLDVVEEPLINTASERTLLPGQVVAIHPHLIHQKRSLSIWIGDTYLIGEKSVENLTPYIPEEFI